MSLQMPLTHSIHQYKKFSEYVEPLYPQIFQIIKLALSKWHHTYTTITDRINRQNYTPSAYYDLDKKLSKFSTDHNQFETDLTFSSMTMYQYLKSDSYN